MRLCLLSTLYALPVCMMVEGFPPPTKRQRTRIYVRSHDVRVSDMHAGISGVCGRVYSNTEYEDAFIVVLTAPTLPLTSRWLMCHHAARVCYTHTHTHKHTRTHTHTHTRTPCVRILLHTRKGLLYVSAYYHTCNRPDACMHQSMRVCIRCSCWQRATLCPRPSSMRTHLYGIT